MSRDNLVPKQTIRKDGVATTVHVNPDKDLASAQRLGRVGIPPVTIGSLNKVPKPEQMAHTVLVNDVPMYISERGGSLNDALRMADTYRAIPGNENATISLRSSGSETNGSPVGEAVTVDLRPLSEGRTVAWVNGDCVTIEELEGKGLTLDDIELRFEEYIETGEHFEIDNVIPVERMLHDSDVDFTYVYARTDEDNPDIVNVDVAIYENFLWDLDNDEDKEDLNALLTRHGNIVDEIFHDDFNANIIDVIDGEWDTALVEIRIPVKRERFTPSLVMEDVWEPLAKYRNETDPGTFGSPYVMADVWKRIEEAERKD